MNEAKRVIERYISEGKCSLEQGYRGWIYLAQQNKNYYRACPL
ncbi:hypothetical protein ACPWSR_05075 [Alloiococcus sp. CFN-8]